MNTMNDRYCFAEEQDYNNAKDSVFARNSTIYYRVFWCGLRQGVGYCVEGLSSLSSDESKWIINTLNEHNGYAFDNKIQSAKSSERRSTYVFAFEKDYNEAKDAIYYWNWSVYKDSDKIYFYGYWGGEYRIDLLDGLTAIEAEKVASLMREHHGQFVPNP